MSLALIAIDDYKTAWEHVERARELGEEIPAALVEELRRRASSS